MASLYGTRTDCPIYSGKTELSLLQLTQQLDDLFNAVQFAIHDKLPIKLVKPTTLQNLL
jgi:hypothetical protein